ncbi:MAG: LysE family translocator [Acidobacteria bacterium]|nr:LysE family translocator [Acidobacteriota bacterium]MBU4307108.1 LysE family translocator [Acidobacteriota bacterium]MCG2812631.1 LysE family translocator [Candidatus Aminicenantes bacterium]
MWLTYLLFYVGCFFIGFFLCIPIGPVNLEVFQSAIKKHPAQALSIALGAALGDAIWALAAFFGITPFLKNSYNLSNGYNLSVEGIFLLITAAITFILGMLTLKDARFLEKIEKREEAMAQKIKRKRWAFVKGLTMVLINPLGIASWMIALSFMKKLKIYIPLELSYEIFFMLIVILGAFSYFTLIIFITNRMKSLFSPQRITKIVRILGYVLIAFSLYFLYFALKALFFSPQPY